MFVAILHQIRALPPSANKEDTLPVNIPLARGSYSHQPNGSHAAATFNVDHHVMHTSQNHQPSTKKEYRSINFAAVDLKILIMIDNHASYNKQPFWS